MGVAGLDLVLRGGLPRNRVYLVQGEPGTGKTTLAMQFLMEGARRGEQGLYITFSETREELEEVGLSHDWSLDRIALLELSSIEQQLKPEAQNTVFHPAEVEMNQTTQLLIQEVEKVKPSRIVFDSVSELRMLAETSLRYRRQMLALKQFFSGRKSTVLLLDDLTASPDDLQVQSIVHGVLNLQKTHPEFGNECRRMNVVKLRGVDFVGGFHDYTIEHGGLKVYPRIAAMEVARRQPSNCVSSGLPALDALLGGGLDRGTSNLFMGPAGTGKSTLAIQYAVASAERGEHVSVFEFEESMNTLLNRTMGLGMDLEKYVRDGTMDIQKIDPAQLSPGEFSHLIRKSVLEKNTRMIIIDSLNGYLHAMPQEEFLTLQLHELFAFLAGQGVVTLMVLAQQGLMGVTMTTPIDLTYLADTVIITRYFEAVGAVKKAVSVVKKRGGKHETTIREFSMGSGGVVVGNALSQFHGVLSGIPTYVGQNASMLGEPSG